MPTSVPDVFTGLRERLLARPVILAGGVAVHLGPRGTEAEQILLLRASMTGAAHDRWGAGVGANATREPVILSGSVFVALVEDSDDKAAEALRRAGVLLDEVAVTVAEDPTVGGAVVPPRRASPPLVDSAQWLLAGADEEGTAVTHVRVDFSVSWQAINQKE